MKPMSDKKNETKQSVRNIITLWSLFTFSTLLALLNGKAYFGIQLSQSDNDIQLILVGAFLSILVWQISWYFNNE
tara:strand:+ start:41168 stop:41392 length:225 start_codon:yes stop_codon:yes gene_type:complete